MTCGALGRWPVLVSLLGCSLALGSVRVDGLNSSLAGFIDDPVTDILRYPQLNVLAPGWLVGVELSPAGDYYQPYGRMPGRVAVAAALDIASRYSREYWDPSVAIATHAGPLAVGASATVGLTAVPATPPMDYYPPECGALYDLRDIAQVVLGARWQRPEFALDFDVGGDMHGYVMWLWPGPDPLTPDFYHWRILRLAPALRLGLPGEHLTWRGIVSYRYQHGTGASGSPAWTWHAASLRGGPIVNTGNLLAACGVELTVSDSASEELPSFWTVRLPVGVELTSRWFAFRCGVDAGASFAGSWRDGPLYPELEHHVYLGLGLKPFKHLRLDCAPDLGNDTGPFGWELAASYEF
jgi:hypothetical protein